MEEPYFYILTYIVVPSDCCAAFKKSKFQNSTNKLDSLAPQGPLVISMLIKVIYNPLNIIREFLFLIHPYIISYQYFVWYFPHSKMNDPSITNRPVPNTRSPIKIGRSISFWFWRIGHILIRGSVSFFVV